jgi:hypothetical protein
MHFVLLFGVKQSLGGWPPPRMPVEQELARFFTDTGPYVSGITRDGEPTYGNPFAKGANRGPLLPVYQLELPRKVSATGQSQGSSGLKTARAAGWSLRALERAVLTACRLSTPKPCLKALGW